MNESIGRAINATPIKSAKPMTTAKRAPLTSKLSNDLINLPSTPIQVIKGEGKGGVGKKGPKTVSDIGSDVVFTDIKLNVQKDKTKTKRTEGKRTGAKAGVSKKRTIQLDGVILPLSKSTPVASRKPLASQITRPTSTVVVSEITEDISALSIDLEEKHEPSTSVPVLSPAEQLERLVSSCTSTNIHDFSAFITSPAVSSLLDPNTNTSTGSSTTTGFRKVGEASYSEVFSMGIVGGNKIVIKVIPLVGHEEQVHEDEDGKQGDVPDTSYPKDVLRELEITQRMGGGEGATSGFVNFLG